MRIVQLSHTTVLSPFRVGSHHLAREFASAGHRAVHVASAISLAHLIDLRDPLTRARAKRAVLSRMSVQGPYNEYIPLTVMPATRLGIRGFASHAVPHSIVAALDGPPDVVFVDQPFLARWGLPRFAGARVIARPTDIARTGPEARAWQWLLARVDGVVATSSGVWDSLNAGPRMPHIVVENGVDYAHFVGGVEPDQRSGAVYVGALDSRFAWPLIRAASNGGKVQVDLWGPQAPGDQLRGLKNISYRGKVDYADLPTLLSKYRIGLLPLVVNDLNAARSPMKLYEYLAAGLTVVSSIQVRSDVAASKVVFAPSEAKFAQATMHLSELGSLDTHALVDTRMAWPSRAGEILHFAESL